MQLHKHPSLLTLILSNRLLFTCKIYFSLDYYAKLLFSLRVWRVFFILKQYYGLLWIIVIKDAVMLGIGLSIYSVSTLLSSHQEDYLLACVRVFDGTLHTVRGEVGVQLRTGCVIYCITATDIYSLSVFPPVRPGYPRAAVLLHAVVSQQSGGAREPLRAPPAGPGRGPDSPPPQPASLGRLPGLREAAAAGPHSSYTHYSYA